MKRILPVLLITAVTLMAYAPALRNGFVWDDTALILRDPLIRSWRLIPEGFQHFLFTDATASDFYRPLQRLTYTLDYAAFSFRPLGYHLTSLACHIAAALALFLLSLELLGFLGVEDRTRCRIAFLAALAWAVHPVHTAAVVYVSGRADPLAAVFGFLGLYCGLRTLRTNGSLRWILLAVAGLLFLCSALSKEAGLIFLLVWGTILVLRKKWKDLRPATTVILFVAVIYLSLRLPAEHIPPPTLHPPAPLHVRPILIARALAEYTGLILLPINLHMDRDVETHPKSDSASRPNEAARRNLQTLLGIALAAGFLYWFIRSRKRDEAVACCLLLAGVTYLPISGLFPLNATVAEHWIYLPLAFLFLAGGLAISRLTIPSTVIGSVLAIWLLFLAGRTWTRTFDWKDQRTFLERTIASGGDSVRMWINLAGLEIGEEHFDSAKQHLALALHEEPKQPLALLHLAAIAMHQGDFSTARDLLNEASKIPMVEARSYELLALLEQQEHGEPDLKRLRLASHTGPPNWSIEKRYVQALDRSGAIPIAIGELRSCLLTQWYRADTWQLLSDLLNKQGQAVAAAEAMAHARDYDVHLDERSLPPAR